MGGTARCTAANSTRPTVTMPQKTVSATDAAVAEAPIWRVISIWAQLPFMVSHTP